MNARASNMCHDSLSNRPAGFVPCAYVCIINGSVPIYYAATDFGQRDLCLFENQFFFSPIIVLFAERNARTLKYWRRSVVHYTIINRNAERTGGAGELTRKPRG